MLFHKFKKLPEINFLVPLDFSQWGQKLPPKKDVNVLPCLPLHDSPRVNGRTSTFTEDQRPEHM